MLSRKSSPVFAVLFFIFLAVAVWMTVIIAGTARSPSPVGPSVTDPVGTNAPEKTEKLSLEEKFGKKSFDGTTIYFLTGGDTNWWVNYDIAGPSDGEVLSEALYRRNTEIEDTFDCTIVHDQKTHNEAGSAIRRDVNSGDHNYDSYFCNGTQMTTLLSGALAANLNEISAFDFTDPWWNKTVNDTLNWGGKYRYFAMGDMNIMSWKSTACIMYNYTLAKTLGLEDAFGLVKEGKWTVDVWNEMIAAAVSDLNANDRMDYDQDRYGLVCGNQTFEYTLNGVGESCAAADADNWPVLFELTDRKVAALEQLTKVFSHDTTLNVHDASYSGGTSLAGQSAKFFSTGRFLFFAETICGSFQLWDMEDDYGFLPFPKFDESQEKYNSLIQSPQMSIVTIPYGAEARLEETTAVINAMGYLNGRDIKTVFFDHVFGTRSVRDHDLNVDMLSLILQDRTFDLGVTLNPGKIINALRIEAIEGTSSFASVYAANVDAAKADYAKIRETLGD